MENASVLVIRNDQFPAGKVEKTLLTSGWEVIQGADAGTAERLLIERERCPFTLLVAGADSDVRNVENLFNRTSELSPLTRKLLLFSAGAKASLIHTINTTDIHACLCFPFAGRDLIRRAMDCRRDFIRSMERGWLQDLVQRQSYQLYEATRNLKKKEALNRGRLKQLNLQLRRQVSSLPLPPASTGKYFNIGAKTMEKLFVELSAKHCPDWNPENRSLSQLPQGRTRADVPAAAFAFNGLLNHFKSTEHVKNDIAYQKGLSPDGFISEYLDLAVTENATQALLIKKTNQLPGWLTAAAVNSYLLQNDIFFGIKPSDEIENWLKGDEDRFVAAQGSLPSLAVEGKVTYHFEMDYMIAGRVCENGTIDFRDRGKVPYVEEGDLLAVKFPPQAGTSGITVRGMEILPAIPQDVKLYSGAGTRLSDDGLRVYAKKNGRPFVDTRGKVTVSKELYIKGDVDYSTGNVNFDGHILVRGVVRPGFSVKGIHLTAMSVEGANVELTGNLKVFKGIIDSTISSVENLEAGFVNKSEIYAYRTVAVAKEILDSKILTSGCVDNTHGHIMASRISARQGIITRKVGTTGSRSPHLRVGVKDHAYYRIEQINYRIAACNTGIKAIKKEIQQIRRQESRLQEKIVKADEDRIAAESQIKKYRDILNNRHEKGGPSTAYTAVLKINRKEKQIHIAETSIKEAISLQDKIRDPLAELNHKLVLLEEESMALHHEQQNFEVFSLETKPLARVEISQNLFQGAIIVGPNSQIKIQKDTGRCKVEEVFFSRDGFYEYIMRVR